MLFKQRNAGYTDVEGPVRYLDGSPLNRPFNMPRQALVLGAVFVIAAAIIGGVIVHNIFDTVLNAPAREAATVQENLSRDVSYDLPQLASLMSLDDATIKQTFIDAGYTVYDKNAATENPSGSLELIKLPSDVTEVDAALLYAQGISNLSAADAAKLLKGSWTFSASRNDYTDLRVKYADFTSGSVEAAVQAAIVAEGLDATTLGESGVDDAGNTFQAGTVDMDGTSYSWRVSAIALSSVYNISGIPNTAVYVGIRMTP